MLEGIYWRHKDEWVNMHWERGNGSCLSVFIFFLRACFMHDIKQVYSTVLQICRTIILVYTIAEVEIAKEFTLEAKARRQRVELYLSTTQAQHS